MKNSTTTILMSCILFLTILNCQSEKEESWYSKEAVYEGLPLFLRYPSAIQENKYRKKYPILLTVTLELESVTSNGLPESGYNKLLFAVDQELTKLFEKEQLGRTVLVETFAGKRHFYIYISADAKTKRLLKEFKNRYPKQRFSEELRNDGKRDFIARYSKEYKLYEKKSR